MTKDLFKTYSKEICSNCRDKENCQEELRIRLDNSIKCDGYKKRLTGS